MVQRLNQVLGVSEADLDAAGVFNGFIGIDCRLHIDPHLLLSPSTPELAPSAERVKRYFSNVIRVLSHSKHSGDIFWEEARNKLKFRELPVVGLGFANGSNRGSGIGLKLAGRIADRAASILKVGIDDPAIFEMMSLLGTKIGPDRISDMTARIIVQDLLRFTDRVARELNMPRKMVGNTDLCMPRATVFGEETGVILLPKEILRDLPTALDWKKDELASIYNEMVRDTTNQLIQIAFKDAVESMKQELTASITSSPVLLRRLLEHYKAKPPERYDFELDPAGEVIWYQAALEHTRRHPLYLNGFDPNRVDTVLEVVMEICERYKDLMEFNGLSQLIYNEKGGKLKHERAAQLLFYGVADAYCTANGLDLSREANAGRGAVDFKVSEGDAKVTVDLKYSSNQKLKEGYVQQLPTYNRAEQASRSVYLIIRVGENEEEINYLLKRREDELKLGQFVPEIVVVEGRKMLSASKLG